MKDARTDAFIWSLQWRQKAHSILQRDGYIDQYILKKYGRYESADTVHHIFPREQYPQYAMADWNLISLSKSTHTKIIHTIKGTLTNEGRKLMLETAFINNISLREKILVIGQPGSGKTTYVKDQLGLDAICYDMDAIAAAFRLTDPHSENHKGARRLAAKLAGAFAARAQEFCPRIFIIRTAPSAHEIAQIRPDRLCICTGVYDIRRRKDFEEVDSLEIQKRIEDAKKYCELNGIPVMMIPAGSEF